MGMPGPALYVHQLFLMSYVKWGHHGTMSCSCAVCVLYVYCMLSVHR
jgi:hypothetical protein